MRVPVCPVKMLVMQRTRSSGVCVFPAVTRILMRAPNCECIGKLTLANVMPPMDPRLRRGVVRVPDILRVLHSRHDRRDEVVGNLRCRNRVILPEGRLFGPYRRLVGAQVFPAVTADPHVQPQSPTLKWTQFVVHVIVEMLKRFAAIHGSTPFAAISPNLGSFGRCCPFWAPCSVHRACRGTASSWRTRPQGHGRPPACSASDRPHGAHGNLRSFLRAQHRSPTRIQSSIEEASRTQQSNDGVPRHPMLLDTPDR